MVISEQSYHNLRLGSLDTHSTPNQVQSRKSAFKGLLHLLKWQ